MPDTELALASLLSRISQLEKRQNIVSKYMVGLKHQFDGMTEELQQIEPLKEKLLELQQRFNQLPSLINSLNNAEVVKPIFEQVKQQQPQEAIAQTVIPPSSESVVDTAEVGLNVDAAETNQDDETDTTAQQEESTKAFSDEEFKIEKVMWLLNRIYAAE